MKKGFTVLEMIVSMGIFTIAIFIGVGSLLATTNAQKKALLSQSTQDNIRFSFETITKDIRTGDFYYCGSNTSDIPSSPSQKDCSNGGPSFTFVNATGSLITYQARSNRIQKKIGASNFEPVTSSDVSVEYMTFYVIGSSDTDSFHPRFTITVKGVSGSGSTRSELQLQTTVSRRVAP